MPAQTIQIEAFVLSRLPPSETHQASAVFSAEHGNLQVLQRVPRKPSPSRIPLDLFDEAALVLESRSQGTTWFVGEVTLIERHDAIGRSYDALRAASALAAVIRRNPLHEESRPKVASLLRSAFRAFGRTGRPDVVYVKSVYRLARDEGYPMREDWLPSLAQGIRSVALGILSRPVAAQEAAPAEVERIRRNLENYLHANTGIVFGP